MNCPICGEEIEFLNVWENKKYEIDIKTQAVVRGYVTDFTDIDLRVECPECGEDISSFDEINTIVEKVYGD